MKSYDLAIIGGGPGGYVAAIRAAQLGMKVALIEKSEVGGTCLHKGCIPTKSLLRSAEVYRQTQSAREYGIDLAEVTINFTQIQKRKEKIVAQLHQGVKSLLKKGKVSVYDGIGRILGPSIFSPMAGTISVEHSDGSENTMITPKYVIIATGSCPKLLPGIKIDSKHILTSDHALEMEELPGSMAIIGGGVIGVEWASLLVDLDVSVTLIEYSDRLLPTEDLDISKEIEKQLVGKGVKVITDASVKAAEYIKDQAVRVSYQLGDEENQLHAEKVLLATGRQANTYDIGLDNTSIVLEDGYIVTNEFYQTKESHIYAIGDVIGGKQLAHVASQEGIIAVEHMAGKDPLPLKQENIPACVYSHPEVASVGLSEEEAKNQGYRVKTGKFPFQANGKALIYGDYAGFVKVVANEVNNDILGIHMIGPMVTEMISEASLAKFLDATPWELSKSIHPHPTLSESIQESALAVEGLAIHF